MKRSLACKLAACFFLVADAATLKSQSSTGMKGAPLFSVAVSYDWENHDPSKGVTMKMDKVAGSLKMVAGVENAADCIAWGYMKEDLAKDGWIKLFLQTSDSATVSNDVRMYSAGFLEGMLTATRISQFYTNFYQTIMKDETTGQAMGIIKKVFKDELDFVRTNSNFHAGVITTEPLDPYWKHMRYQYVQMWGMMDGYNTVALKKGVRQMDLLDFVIINSHAELPELMQAYTPAAIEKRRAFQLGKPKEAAKDPEASAGAAFLQKDAAFPVSLHANMSMKEVDDDWEKRLIRRGRCSALVRVAPESKDLLVGHTTWGDYAKMTRIFKYYHFELPNAYTKAKQIGFSSYPGCISSTDDFYEMDSGLVVMDTSLEILNMDLYNRVAEFPTNSHVPDFMHVMTANRMASSAPHWANLFSEKNSGTDNAQWMIVDYNRFIPGEPVPDNTLWVLEQVPGMMFRKDMSFYLRDTGYFASYNRPYFKQVRAVSGHTAAEAKYGALYSYGNGPRANIFKAVAPLAEGLMDMRSVMNRNQYPGEGILPNEPGHAISARMDLAFSKIPNGGIDAKVVNRCLLRSLQCQAISGPTHVTQPVFKWRDGVADMMKGWPHLGMPDVYDFDWVQMTPTAPLKHLVDVDKC